MTNQDIRELIAEVRHSDMADKSKEMLIEILEREDIEDGEDI